MTRYHFVTTWRFEAPIEEVYRVLSEAHRWPAWWPSVTAVEQLAPGDERGVGRVYRYVWKSRLGYRLRFDIRVTRVESPWLIEGEASGDVQGIGRWRLIEEGAVTQVRYEWRVFTTRRWMNLIAPVARPLFAWSHHAVMRDGAVGLARRLGARLLAAAHD
ncbi:polyketide cyclase [Halomonas campisalis]|uniref:Polyketide cyclase n=1 Tax=Billgrantia campisalis TaxID=74661 RepID=A0ABS9P724_9GAMM|nr:SRPBCC family protein [Halomonas campisalis]MCG6657590.1 polyketide cyclase [Halomonas campisalis]MDR5862636.1 SRPBCC family protein [Halomonas campisalis]